MSASHAPPAGRARRDYGPIQLADYLRQFHEHVNEVCELLDRIGVRLRGWLTVRCARRTALRYVAAHRLWSLTPLRNERSVARVGQESVCVRRERSVGLGWLADCRRLLAETLRRVPATAPHGRPAWRDRGEVLASWISRRRPRSPGRSRRRRRGPRRRGLSGPPDPTAPALRRSRAVRAGSRTGVSLRVCSSAPIRWAKPRQSSSSASSMHPQWVW